MLILLSLSIIAYCLILYCLTRHLPCDQSQSLNLRLTVGGVRVSRVSLLLLGLAATPQPPAQSWQTALSAGSVYSLCVLTPCTPAMTVLIAVTGGSRQTRVCSTWIPTRISEKILSFRSITPLQSVSTRPQEAPLIY